MIYSLDVYLFPIGKQSVVLCMVLTVASWPAYRFLRRQVRCQVFPSLSEFSTVCCDLHSQRLWHNQWNRSRCFSGHPLLFLWSSGCWQFDLWLFCRQKNYNILSGIREWEHGRSNWPCLGLRKRVPKEVTWEVGCSKRGEICQWEGRAAEKAILRPVSLRGLVFPEHSEQLSVLGMKAWHSKWRSLGLFFMLWGFHKDFKAGDDVTDFVF